MFDHTNIGLHRIAVAAIGAIILSTTCVGAAVGPARTAETAPSQLAQAQLSDEVRA